MPAIADNLTPKMKLDEIGPIALGGPEIDLMAVRERVGNDERLVRMLIRFFLADAPLLMTRLHQAAASRSDDNLHSLAHKLKGLAANVNANAVRKFAQQLEDDTRSGHIEDVQSAVADLQVCVERALAYLRKA